ncbi:MAG: aspartate aminotransferase family protein [Candidatus Thermoplasmatota archaeon]|nr:aspartate aminotransferase family protein [Candidatus Thermoplasmatota archaeon]
MKSEYDLSFEEAPAIKTTLPGPKSRVYLDKQDALETNTRTYTGQFRLAVEKARGSTIRDMDGNVFIDWFSGICVLNLGHSHPVVKNAMMEQLDTLVHINEIPSETRINFLETLNSTLPGKLRNHSKTMFTVTGADAVEAGMAMARHLTGRKTIVAFGGSYHGVAGDVVAATSNHHYRDNANLDLRNIYHLPYAYPYRFPVRASEDEISQIIVDQLEYLIRDPYAGPGAIGGVLVEPIQGEGGYIVPPEDFMPMLREVTEKHGIPLIVDEVQTGVGRTGKMWASEYSNITPDIMCISKSIGGGIPTSMISYHEEYDRKLPSGFHLGTYRGNPVALAAGNAILNFLKTSDTLERVREKGAYIRKRFEEIAEDNPMIGDVRGKGFMVAAELVIDREKKTPGTDLASRAKNAMFQRGLLMHTCGHFSNVMRHMAPLTIEDRLIEKGLEIFGDSIRETSKSH